MAELEDSGYLTHPHTSAGRVPSEKGYRFYVECVRGSDGLCQQSGRRKTLRCSVQAHPPATVYKWLKNGVVTRCAALPLPLSIHLCFFKHSCQ